MKNLLLSIPLILEEGILYSLVFIIIVALVDLFHQKARIIILTQIKIMRRMKMVILEETPQGINKSNYTIFV